MMQSNSNAGWVNLISEFIPTAVKSHKWRMWEYRTLHSWMSRRYGLCFAYEITRTLLDN